MAKVYHGVESAHYTNGYYGYLPVIRCECGFSTRYGWMRWQDVGEEFDQHLEDRRSEIEAADEDDDDDEA